MVRFTVIVMATLLLPACERFGASDQVAVDAAPDSLAHLGFAESMEEIARQESPCLTSEGAIPPAWTTLRLASPPGALRLPPRFERRPAGDAGAVLLVNPDSAQLELVPSSTAGGGPEASGAGLEGLRERLCSLRVAGRLTRVMELRRQRPGRVDSLFSAIAIAFPNDSLTFMATIVAPTRDGRSELLRSLTTLTLTTSQ